MTRFVVCLALVWVMPSMAAAPRDWFSSVSTRDGVELRNDPNVFALFAVLDAGGFDEGRLVRALPVRKFAYEPARMRVRERLRAQGSRFALAATAFFDAHPFSIDAYLASVVDPGDRTPAKTASPTWLISGLDALLDDARTQASLDELWVMNSAEYRKVQLSYLDAIEPALGRVRKRLECTELDEWVLLINLLDADGSVRTIRRGDGQTIVTVGPSATLLVDGVLEAFASSRLEKVTAHAAARWREGAKVLREAQANGAAQKSVEEYANSVISAAVVRWARAAPGAAVGGADKFVDEAQGIEDLVATGLERVESRRPTKK
jgi:hypothetical protein